MISLSRVSLALVVVTFCLLVCVSVCSSSHSPLSSDPEFSLSLSSPSTSSKHATLQQQPRHMQAQQQEDTMDATLLEMDESMERRRRRRRRHRGGRLHRGRRHGGRRRGGRRGGRRSGLKRAFRRGWKRLKRAAKRIGKRLGLKGRKRSRKRSQKRSRKRSQKRSQKRANKKSAAPPRSFYATLSRSLTWKQAAAHCSSAGLQLCSAKQVCKHEAQRAATPRLHSRVVPTRQDNQWVHIHRNRTCSLRSKPSWGAQPIFKQNKGPVACCALKSSPLKSTRVSRAGVASATPSRWEGFLVQQRGHSKIFMVEAGRRRQVPDIVTFKALGFRSSRIVRLSRKRIKAIPLGQPLARTLPGKKLKPFKHAVLGYGHDGGRPWDSLEGFLVKRKGKHTVYMIELGRRKAIPNPATFEALGFQWNAIKTIPRRLLRAIPRGSPFKPLASPPRSMLYRHPLLGLNHNGQAQTASELSREGIIVSVYGRLLGRRPSVGEINKWKSRLAARRDVSQLVRAVVLSREYRSKHFWPNVIRNAYSVVLERAPSPVELRLAKSRLAALKHKPIRKYLRELIESHEHRKKFLKSSKRNSKAGVNYLYRHVLGRNPESRKVVRSWARQARASGWQPVIRSFFHVPEYARRVGPYGVPGRRSIYNGLIKHLYRALLNREAEPLAVAQWSTALKQNGYEAVINAFINSKEYRQKAGRSRFYDQTNNRVALRAARRRV